MPMALAHDRARMPVRNLPLSAMDLGRQRASHNVEDRRGMGVAAGGIGVGGIVIALIAYFLGVDPAPLLEMSQQAGGGSSAQEVQRGAPSDETGSSSRRCSAARRMSGTASSGVPMPNTVRRRSCSTKARCAPPAAWGRRRSTDAFRRAGRFRAGLCDRARGRTSRAEVTGSFRKLEARAAAFRRPNSTGCQSEWSCRPTATQASGDTTPAE